jgi:S1-C subfamily serine protease
MKKAFYLILITSIADDGLARKARIVEGDIIIAFNNSPVTSIDDLHILLIDKQVGTETFIKVLRRTEIINLNIARGELRR